MGDADRSSGFPDPPFLNCYRDDFGSHSFSPSAVAGTEILLNLILTSALGKGSNSGNR
jgi:hypothetical protein